MKKDPESVWICVHCCIERGYRIPFLGSVAAKPGKCNFCSNWDIVFDVDDLLHVMDKDPIDGVDQ